MPKKYQRKKQELVLVVDDDPGVQDLTRDFLELYGHSVLIAGNRGDAVTLCEQCGKDISVVLLDVMASETASFDLFQKILAINPATKIIVTSVYSHQWNDTDVFNRGAAGFLKKPYRMSELLKMVEGAQETQ